MGQDLSGVPDERSKQAELGRCEHDRLTVHVDGVVRQVDPDPSVVVHRGLARRRGRPPKQRPDACDQLVVAEGLGQVVVGSSEQAPHLVGLEPPGGEEDHRYLAVVSYSFDSRAVHPGKPHVDTTT